MNKKLLTITSLALGAGVLISTASGVLAYRGDPNTLGVNCTAERHEAMINVIENKDYNAWKELMQGKGRIIQVVDENNFARFSEMYQLRLEGKTDEANQIRTELGLGLRNGSGGSQVGGYGKINR